MPDYSDPQWDRAALVAELERLRAERDALQAAAERAEVQRANTQRTIGNVLTKTFVGVDLRKATEDAWSAWERWLSGARDGAWPRGETKHFAASLVARLTRVRSVYVVVGLVPAFIVAVQLVVLVQQNRILDRQNMLMAFEQTTTIRELLQTEPRGGRWPLPNASARAQVVQFGEADRRSRGDVVIPALVPLLKDDDGSVASGALLILRELEPDLRFGKQNLGDAAQLARTALSLQDLSGLSFARATFEGADLTSATLNAVDLSEARLVGTDFDGALLQSATLNGANLTDAVLSNTNLTGASLRGAVLDGTRLLRADLTGADLRDAELNNADLRGAVLDGVDLEGVKNWNAVASWSRATLRNLRNAPDGLVAAARAGGATVE
ncbi:MAG: pentapeptide repeat-containing protein [Bacteroidota bacterium]